MTPQVIIIIINYFELIYYLELSTVWCACFKCCVFLTCGCLRPTVTRCLASSDKAKELTPPMCGWKYVCTGILVTIVDDGGQKKKESEISERRWTQHLAMVHLYVYITTQATLHLDRVSHMAIVCTHTQTHASMCTSELSPHFTLTKCRTWQ